MKRKRVLGVSDSVWTPRADESSPVHVPDADIRRELTEFTAHDECLCYGK